MIKKIIACSDVHIRTLKRHAEIFEILSGFFENIKREMEGFSPEEVRIVVAGDIFDSKIDISNEGVLAVHWFLNELDKLAKTIVIAGNHDYQASNTERVDSLTPIFAMSNFQQTVYLDKELEYGSGYMEDDDVVWVLYSTFENFSSPSVSAIKRKYPEHTYIGLIHGEVNGSRTDDGYKSDNGLQTTLFKGLDFVIAGHIHRQQELRQGNTRIVYCGSIIQQNNGENITGHGYVVWNLEDNSYEFKSVDNQGYGYYLLRIENADDILKDEEKLINVE